MDIRMYMDVSKRSFRLPDGERIPVTTVKNSKWRRIEVSAYYCYFERRTTQKMLGAKPFVSRQFFLALIARNCSLESPTTLLPIHVSLVDM